MQRPGSRDAQSRTLADTPHPEDQCGVAVAVAETPRKFTILDSSKPPMIISDPATTKLPPRAAEDRIPAWTEDPAAARNELRDAGRVRKNQLRRKCLGPGI